MKILVDTHTHSVASGHAYSTVQEMAEGASKAGIKMFAVTDHGPGMPGTTHIYHFGNLKVLPSELYGVRILKGAESNIMDNEGHVDISGEYLMKLDLVIASFHDICFSPATMEVHTHALMNILKNPLIDIIGHSGNPQFPIDYDTIVKSAEEYNKLIEINNSSFTVRAGSADNCKAIALKCKEYGVRIVCGSDAHISFDVGRFDYVYSLLKEIDFPEELVLSASVERFDEYLFEKKKRIGI